MNKLVQVDVSDWDSVDFAQAKESLDDLDDFSRMTVSIDPIGAITFMEKFIAQVELIRDKQIKASTKQIPALFKPKE